MSLAGILAADVVLERDSDGNWRGGPQAQCSGAMAGVLLWRHFCWTTLPRVEACGNGRVGFAVSLL